MSSSIKLVRTHTAVLLLASTLAVPAIAAPPPPATKSTVEVALSKIHIENFGRINPNYYRGSQPTTGITPIWRR